MEGESEPVKLESNGKCLFCKSPPAASKQLAFYSVRTLLQYLQMGEVKVPVKPEAEEEQPETDQFIDVNLKGSTVEGALCEGCGDLVETFSEGLGLERMLRLCLASIQSKMEVGNENVRVEDPIRERIILKEALQRLQRTQPAIVSIVSPRPEVIPVPPEIVKIEVDEDDAEGNVADDPSLASSISGGNQMEDLTATSCTQPQKKKRGRGDGTSKPLLQKRISSQKPSTSRKRKSSESSRSEQGQGQPKSKMPVILDCRSLQGVIGMKTFETCEELQKENETPVRKTKSTKKAAKKMTSTRGRGRPAKKITRPVTTLINSEKPWRCPKNNCFAAYMHASCLQRHKDIVHGHKTKVKRVI